MKAMKSKRQKSKFYTVLPVILTFTVVVLLSVPYTIQSSYAQVTSGNIGWYGAMAMGNLAERESRIEVQKAAKEHEERIASVITVTDNDNTAYGNDLEEKDLTEK